MTMPRAAQVQSRLQLPDGRLVRAATVGETLKFDQLQFLQLVQNARRRNPSEGRAAFNPLGESLMENRDFEASVQNVSFAALNIAWTRMRGYAVYRRRFETQDLPLGERLVYIENGVRYGFTIPEVSVTLPSGSRVSLQQATGMAVFDVMKIDVRVVDKKTVEVSVTPDFNPETDVKVKDVMRPCGWSAHIDADGFALRGSPSNAENPNARYSYVRYADQFEDIKHLFVSDEPATGYHGSLARGNVNWGCYVVAGDDWSEVSGVALVSLASSVQGTASLLELVRTADQETLRGVFAQLPLEKRAAIMRALQSLEGGIRQTTVSTSSAARAAPSAQSPASAEKSPREQPASSAAPPRGGPLEID